MVCPRVAAQTNGMRRIEDAVFRAITSRGVNLRDHFFSWKKGLSPIMHRAVCQLSLHLRDGRILFQNFSVEEVECAEVGVFDDATLQRVRSIAQTLNPMLEAQSAL
jgi:hypothetical protein